MSDDLDAMMAQIRRSPRMRLAYLRHRHLQKAGYTAWGLSVSLCVFTGLYVRQGWPCTVLLVTAAMGAFASFWMLAKGGVWSDKPGLRPDPGKGAGPAAGGREDHR